MCTTPILGTNYACSRGKACSSYWGKDIDGTMDDVATACIASSGCKVFHYSGHFGSGQLCDSNSSSIENNLFELCVLTQGLPFETILYILR